MIRSTSLEAAILNALAADPLSSTNGLCRKLGSDNRARSNSQSIRRSLKVLASEGRVENVGDIVAAWKLAS